MYNLRQVLRNIRGAFFNLRSLIIVGGRKWSCSVGYYATLVLHTLPSSTSKCQSASHYSLVKMAAIIIYPAKRELWSVIWFLLAEGNSAAEIYQRMSRVYSDKCAITTDLRPWTPSSCTSFRSSLNFRHHSRSPPSVIKLSQ